jgi:hypothetical protein
MANHMVLLARDTNLASELGKQARVRIQNFFSMERSIQGLYGVLETAVKGEDLATHPQASEIKSWKPNSEQYGHLAER